METLSIVIMNWRDIKNPAAGGAEVFTHEVAKRWVASGHDVTVLTSRFDGTKEEDMLDGVLVVRQGSKLSVYNRVKQTYLKRFARETDVVIDEVNTRPFFALRYVSKSTPVFALIYQLAREFWSYEMPFPISMLGRYLLEDHWLKPYRELPTFTISKSTESDLLNLGFRNVSIAPVGLSFQPLDVLPEKESDPTLVFVGRLRRAKLPGHVLQAFISIKKHIPTARLWMIGAGDQREKLERTAPEGTVFFGRVTESEKVGLLKRAHVLIYPAVREGWGLTVTEANAVGTPAVGYDVPGLRDSIRHGSTGLLVPFGHVFELAEAAELLLTDESEYRRIAANALAWSHDFDWNKTAREILERLATGGLNAGREM